MRVRWLGWAGVEIESDGESLVIDPLADAAATFAPLGEAAHGTPLPEVVPAAAGAVAGLVTHLHRDHTDAAALAAALAGGAPVYEPRGFGGEGLENLALAQAEAELAATALAREPLAPWEQRTAGPFTITALPAADGLGDPQVAWLVEADGARVLHLGDTIYHGWWWRMAQRHGPFDLVLAPINGARVSFPHRVPASPLPTVMEPEQAALAGELLGARSVVPIHYHGYDVEGVYKPVDGALERFERASAGRPYAVRVPALGEALEAVSI
jgi:L-ascorbate metabolism protein UlaG (beta-lactamase superfamily)